MTLPSPIRGLSSKSKKREKAKVKLDFARDLSDLLDLPKLGRKGKAYKIVQAIQAALTNGLRRGEDIKIDGFGTFKWRTKPPTRSACVYFYHVNGKGTTIIKDIPAKRYVHFEPSKVLLRMLNEPQSP